MLIKVHSAMVLLDRPISLPVCGVYSKPFVCFAPFLRQFQFCSDMTLNGPSVLYNFRVTVKHRLKIVANFLNSSPFDAPIDGNPVGMSSVCIV